MAPQSSTLDDGTRILGPVQRDDGVVEYRVRSPYQRGETLVRLLTPKTLPDADELRVVFVLPVEPGTQSRFGDGLAEAKKLDLAKRLGAVVVAPTFTGWPWYVDHPTEPKLRQESYVLKVLVPLVARLHPHRASRRGLLGFSKSGWGAFALLLRHPEAFGAAAAWDAPMMMDRPLYELGRIVGTQEQFERSRMPTLLREHAGAVRDKTRLALLGYGNFRKHHQQAHALMDELRIPHVYADGPRRAHHWGSGWVGDAAQALAKMIV